MQDDDLAFLFLAAFFARLDQLGPQTDDHSGKVAPSKHEQGPLALLLTSSFPRLRLRFGLPQLQFLQLLQDGLTFFLSGKGAFPRSGSGQRRAVDAVLRIGGWDSWRFEPLQGGSRTGGEDVEVVFLVSLVRGGGRGDEVLLAEETGQVGATVVGIGGGRGRSFGIRCGGGFRARYGFGEVCR